MASFIGRSGYKALFTEDENAVIVDTRVAVVIASGTTEALTAAGEWSDGGEYSEDDANIAHTALESMASPLPKSTGRLYTIPRGVQSTAKRAVKNSLVKGGKTNASRGGIRMAKMLSAGGQIDFSILANLSHYFDRHRDEAVDTFAELSGEDVEVERSLDWELHGGDAARRWASTIVSREPVTAASTPAFENLAELMADNPEAGPEFIARVDLDKGTVNRLYRVDIDQKTYVWDDDTWEDLGGIGFTIWDYDRELDGEDAANDLNKYVYKHVIIDPESAVQIAARQSAGDDNVYIDDLDLAESRMAKDAIVDLDFELLDSLIAVGAVGDGIYSEEERSENASGQARDATGRFAKVGQQMVNPNNMSQAGRITKIDSASGMATLVSDQGMEQVAPVNQLVPGVPPQGYAPGKPSEIPRVDFSGILGEPRTPINRQKATIPGTLPQMTRNDLHRIVNDFPAWVKAQRDGYQALGGTKSVGVQAKNSLNKGKEGRKLEAETGKTLSTDAYSHPLLAKWLNRTNDQGYYENRLWYRPITAAGEEAEATGEVTPDTTDVQPIYMAIVSPDDPRAVFKLVSLVPAGADSTSPMVYSREEGSWVRDQQTMNDLKSATPPPVIPLDTETLQDVLVQVDDSQAAGKGDGQSLDEEEGQEITADEFVADDAQTVPEQAANEAAAPTVTASGWDRELMVLWGPREDILKAVVAAGGLDRNRGNAEELRRYWTKGEGAAKIRWGTPGDWKRCVRALSKHMVDAEGYCQLRHKEATGKYTGDSKRHASIEDVAFLEDQMKNGTDAERVAAASAILDWGDEREIEIPQNIIDLITEYEAITAAGGYDRNSGGADKLRRYWTKGKGGVKIMWGTPGDWTRCVRYLGKYLGTRAKGYCALRHKEMTGMWTGDKEHRQAFSQNVGSTFSNDYLPGEDFVFEQAFLRARADIARARVGGLTASAAALAEVYDTTTREGLTAAAGAVEHVNAVGGAFWIPLALPEQIESGDGREAEKYAISIRDLPISLLWQFQTDDGHKGSVVVGRIERLGRVPGGIGAGYGHFDTGFWGREAERMVRNGMLRFVSADMDKFEASRDAEDEAAEDENTIKNGKTKITSARVMAVTIVAKPAFQECTIQIVPDAVEEEEVIPDGIYVGESDPLEAAALIAAGYVASAVPLAPPKNWFNNPVLTRPTPLTVDDDGRVFGHIASWDMPHTSPHLNDVRPPKSRSNYAYFNKGVLRTEEGEDVTVGQLTLVGGHAGLSASARQAVKHYDDTASAVADVHAGEDEFGIWVAGSLRPGVQPEQVRALRASTPSGDWRPIKGSLELIAVCQVNVPGFPIARAMVASGQITAMVAAGAAPLAALRENPLAEMASRLEALEQFSQSELKAKADSVRARVQPVLDQRQTELAARSEAVLERMQSFGYVPPKVRAEAADKGFALPDGSYPIRNEEDLKNAISAFGRAKEGERAKVRRHIVKRAKALGKTDLLPDKWNVAASAEMADTVATMRAIIAASGAATEDEKRKIKKLLEERGQKVPDEKPVPEDDSPKAKGPGEEEVKYKPGHQPRDYNGQFRDILARLKDNLGVSGNQAVIEKLKQTDAKTKTGDYATAAKSALDLKGMLDRLDDGALNAEAIGNVRESARALGKVIANLPLPFAEDAQKVRYSDLPPTLRDLMDDFIQRTIDKIGAKDAAVATKKLRAFKSGSDVFSQSEISAEMAKLLRLLT